MSQMITKKEFLAHWTSKNCC